MRVAVIGSGSMGRNHLRVYRELDRDCLVAVADSDEPAAARAGRDAGIPYFVDHRALLEQAKPDAVSVVVPTSAHCEVVMDALAAGCHVLVEKPIAGTVEEAELMVAEAARLKRVLTVGHIERFNPAVIELKRRLDAGELGRQYQIHARRLGPFPERLRDVGVVVDLATHDLDIMRWLSNSEPVRVYAETSREIHTTNEDLMSGIVRFANDTVGVLEINWLTPTKIRELTVTGERGMFSVDYLTQDLYFFENAVKSDGQWNQMSLLRGGVDEGSMTRFRIQRREPLALELAAFLAATRGDEAPLVHGTDGLAALRLALALVESARTHAPVLVGKA
jgi:UDP-N-acetylglucosamine 3-dehydrogenase